jgi:tyrosyl-tRNA synthetase
MEEYADLQNEVEQNPAERKAQRTLAREVTTLVHGRKDMQKAENVSNALFYHQVADLSLEEIEQGLHGVPTYTIVGDQNVKLVDLLVEAKISPSKRRAREDINNRAISINDEKRSDVNTYLTKADRIEGKYIIVRRGKTAYYLVDWSG